MNKWDKKHYAMKIVKFSMQPEYANEALKCEREAQALADLDHINVVRYHSSSTEEIIVDKAEHRQIIGEWKEVGFLNN